MKWRFGLRQDQAIVGCVLLSFSLLLDAAAGELIGARDLVEIAVKSHPSVSGRIADMRSAEHGISAAKWRFGPSITSSSDTADGKISAGQQKGYVAVEQPIWTGGGLSSELSRAMASGRRADWAYEDVRESVAGQVISAYGDWLRSHGQVLAARRAMDAYRQLLATIQRRETSGVASRVEVELVRSRMAAVSSDLAGLESQERVALEQLSQLTGGVVSSSELAFAPRSDGVPDLEEVLTSARMRSPALKRVKTEAEIAAADAAAKRAVLWPHLSVVWQRNFYETGGLPGIKPENDQLLLRLKFSPGAGLSSVSEADAAEARHKALLLDAETAERDLNVKVASSHRKYSSLLASRKSTVMNWLAARNIVSSYQRQFVSGKRSWLEVMNAVRELDQIERSLAEIDGGLAAAEMQTKLLSNGLVAMVGGQ